MTCMVAPSARHTAGISAAGSAWAIDAVPSDALVPTAVDLAFGDVSVQDVQDAFRDKQVRCHTGVDRPLAAIGRAGMFERCEIVRPGGERAWERDHPDGRDEDTGTSE